MYRGCGGVGGCGGEGVGVWVGVWVCYTDSSVTAEKKCTQLSLVGLTVQASLDIA